jgi:hypothetical protein
LEFPQDRKVSKLFKNFLSGLLEKDYTKRFNIAKALNNRANVANDEEKEAIEKILNKPLGEWP